jgi:hypothetical protein
VRVRTAIDCTADLTYPESDLVMDEHGKGQAELEVRRATLCWRPLRVARSGATEDRLVWLQLRRRAPNGLVGLAEPWGNGYLQQSQVGRAGL